jgi:hypothetical protein
MNNSTTIIIHAHFNNNNYLNSIRLVLEKNIILVEK